MKKLKFIFLLITLLFMVTFFGLNETNALAENTLHDRINGIEYSLPKPIEMELLDYIHKEQIKRKVDFYCVISGDRFDTTVVGLIECSLYPPLSNCDSLILSSSRFLILGDLKIPIMNKEDFYFSNRTNIKNGDGTVSVYCNYVGGGYFIKYCLIKNKVEIIKRGDVY